MVVVVGMLVFPNLTQLDLTGPFEVFHRIPDTTVHLVWKDIAPVVAQGGLAIVPTKTCRDCPEIDVLFVPGGFGQQQLADDDEVLSFLASRGKNARYVTSVCTGSLLLGAAGLLDGYDATTHWAYLDLLAAFGARPVKRRVVVDRNRITAAGVSSGIDFGLLVAAEIAGEARAKAIQLGLEYDPDPPYRSGHPDVAEPEIVEAVRARLAPAIASQRASIEKWKNRAKTLG